jgi:hypothetical protein
MAASQTTQQEKDFVAHFSDQQHVLPPDEVLQDPRNMDLGHSSKSLSVRDFELVRTLGTGACLLAACLHSRGEFNWGNALADPLGFSRDFCACVAC